MSKQEYKEVLQGIEVQLSQFGTDVMEMRKNLYDMLSKLDKLEKEVKKLK